LCVTPAASVAVVRQACLGTETTRSSSCLCPVRAAGEGNLVAWGFVRPNYKLPDAQDKCNQAVVPAWTNLTTSRSSFRYDKVQGKRRVSLFSEKHGHRVFAVRIRAKRHLSACPLLVVCNLVVRLVARGTQCRLVTSPWHVSTDKQTNKRVQQYRLQRYCFSCAFLRVPTWCPTSSRRALAKVYFCECVAKRVILCAACRPGDGVLKCSLG
jgi:hypothetical protein